MKKVITITGPSGVGKTDTSWELLETLAKQNISAVLMDADWYANIRPFDWNKEDDVLFIINQIQTLAKQHWDRGTEILIIPHCYELARNFKFYEKFCSENQADLQRICLLSNIDVLKERILKRVRNEEQKSTEYDNASNFLKLFEEQVKNNQLGEILDNSNLTKQETALAILKKAGQ